MKTLFISIFSLATIFSFGQEMTKEERKKIKKMSVDEVAAVIKNLESKSTDLKKCSTEKDEMQLLLNNMSTEMNANKVEIDSLKKVSVIQKEQQEKQALEEVNSNPMKEKTGLYFKVQLGAYNQYRAKGLGKSEIETEMVENQIKYVLGYFTKINKAEDFRDELKKLGLADAWIVCYKDGKRIAQEAAEAEGVIFKK
jgi:hypothetical protein